MTRVWRTILDMLRTHPKCALVTILDGKGSVPREDGARMVVGPDGGFFGTIGGGALEWEAIAKSRELLAGSSLAYTKQRIALGPELGQCCGGNATVSIEVFVQSDRSDLLALAEAEEAGSISTIGRLNAQGRIDRQVVADAPSHTAEWTSEGELRETFGEETRQLMLFGAGHVGRALILALAPLPFRVLWVDSRDDAFPKHMPGNVIAQSVSDPLQALAQLEQGGFVLVMTHSHALDQQITHAALASNRAGFVGLIGSATKRTRFIKRFKDAGLTEHVICQLVCPIGLDGIRSKKPAAIAASTVAQMLSVDERLRRNETIASEAINPVPVAVGGVP